MSVEPQGPSGVLKEKGAPERPGAQTDLARTVARRQAWIQRVLSPWVRRSLTTALPARRGSGAASPSLTEAHTRRFVHRALDRTERAVVWQPDPGSLEPGLVQRFADAIVGRFPAVEAKYEPRTLASSSQDSDDLVLAGVAEHPPAEPQQREGFTPFPSLSAFVEALQVRQSSAQGPSEPGAAPSGAPGGASQRPAGVDMPHPYSVQRTPRTLPPGVRQFSHVEEVIPGQSARDTARLTVGPARPDVAARGREGEPSPPPRTAAEERAGGVDRAPEPRTREAPAGGPPPAPTVQRQPQEAAVEREEGPAAESAPSVEGAPPLEPESEPPVTMPLPPLGEARIEPRRPPMTGAEGELSRRVQREASIPSDAPSVEGAPAERGALPLGPPPARPATQREPDREVREAGSRPPDEGRAAPIPPLATPGRVETPQVRPGPDPVQRRAEAVAPAQPSEARPSQAHLLERRDVEPRVPGALEAPPAAHEAVRPLPTGAPSAQGAPSAEGAPSEAEALPLPPVQRRPGVQAVRQREPVPPAEGTSSERTTADVQPGTTAPPPIQRGPAVEADRERPSVSPVEAAPPAGAALPAGADRERLPPEIGAAPPLPVQRAPAPDAEPTELPLAQRQSGPTAPSAPAERPSPLEPPHSAEAPRPGDAVRRQEAVPPEPPAPRPFSEAEPEAGPSEAAVPPQPAGPAVAQRRTETEAPGRATPHPSVEGRRVAEPTIAPAAEAETPEASLPSAASVPRGPTAPPMAQRQPVGETRPARGEPSVEAPEGRPPVMPLVRPPDVGPHVEQAVPESGAVEPGPTGVERPAAPRADMPVQRRPARTEEDIRAGPEVEMRTEAPERAEPPALRPPPRPASVQRRVVHAEEVGAAAPEGEVRLRTDRGMAILPQARRIQPARERAEAVDVEPHARGRYPSRAVDEGPSPPLYRAPLPAVQRARPADRGLGAPAPKGEVAAPALTPVGELPLSLPIPPAPAVQRQPVDGASAVSLAEGEPAVQRVETLPAESQETREEGGPDLNRLAREVYPYIVRMLAVERERRTGRRGR